jgi:hypothetical protein
MRSFIAVLFIFSGLASTSAFASDTETSVECHWIGEVSPGWISCRFGPSFRNVQTNENVVRITAPAPGLENCWFSIWSTTADGFPTNNYSFGMPVYSIVTVNPVSRLQGSDPNVSGYLRYHGTDPGQGRGVLCRASYGVLPAWMTLSYGS